jgi:hypothetical protein
LLSACHIVLMSEDTRLEWRDGRDDDDAPADDEEAG